MKARSRTHARNGKAGTARRGLLALRADMRRIEGAVGPDAPQLIGATARSWQRWKAGAAITAIPRQAIRNLARLSGLVDLWALLDGRPELSQAARREVEDEVAARFEDEDDEPEAGGTVETEETAPCLERSAAIFSPQEQGSPSADVASEPGPAATASTESRISAADPESERNVKSDGGLVRVRFIDGRVEAVPFLRAARLLDASQARPEGEWSEAQINAVLVAHEQRQGQAAETLARAGLLVGHGAHDAGPPPNKFGQGESGLSRFMRRGF